MSLTDEAREVIRGLAARLDVDELTDEITAAMAGMPEYRRFVGELADDRERGRAAIAWNLSTFLRVAHDPRPLPREDVELLGDLVGVRAAEGRPPEEGLAVYREGLRLTWNAVLARADERERAALSGAVDGYLAWLDVVARVFEDVYAQRRDALISQQERRARRLLDRILAGGALGSEDAGLAEMLAFPLADGYRPIAVSLPGHSMIRHAELASRLRRAGILAATDGPCVVGLAHGRLAGAGVTLERDALYAQDPPTPVAELDGAVGDLRSVLVLASSHTQRGEIDPGTYFPELLGARAPDLARKIQRRVFGELLDQDHPELLDTLVVLADHGFERAAAAAALPVHRNTMTHRLRRIEALCALDLDDHDDRGLIWLATRLRRT